MKFNIVKSIILLGIMFLFIFFNCRGSIDYWIY